MIHSCPLRVVPFQLYGRLSQFPCPHPLFSVYHNSVMVNIKIFCKTENFQSDRHWDKIKDCY